MDPDLQTPCVFLASKLFDWSRLLNRTNLTKPQGLKNKPVNDFNKDFWIKNNKKNMVFKWKVQEQKARKLCSSNRPSDFYRYKSPWSQIIPVKP